MTAHGKADSRRSCLKSPQAGRPKRSGQGLIKRKGDTEGEKWKNTKKGDAVSDFRKRDALVYQKR